MPVSPHIAIVWDFDETLIPGFQQDPLFELYGINPAQFWAENKAYEQTLRAAGHHVTHEHLYLNRLLDLAERVERDGTGPPLTNALLSECGRKLKPMPGMPKFMRQLKEYVKTREWYESPRGPEEKIELHHFIISAGLTEIMRGSAFAECVDDIYGNEFEERDGRIAKVVNFLSPKTAPLFAISKGSDELVDDEVPEDERPFPFSNMIYVGDGGKSDIACFKAVRDKMGTCIGVHSNEKCLKRCEELRNRSPPLLNYIVPADYTYKPRELTPTVKAFRFAVNDIAATIKRTPGYLQKPIPRRVGAVSKTGHAYTGGQGEKT